MCGQPGMQSQGLQMPKFNPMTTNPQGGPPGHFLNQWQPPQQAPGYGMQNSGIVAPRFQPHSMPNRFSGSTATGEPAAYGQAVQPFAPQAPMQGNPFGQGQLMPPDFLFARRNTRP